MLMKHNFQKTGKALCLLLFLFFTSGVMAQTTVKGTVSDENREPLIGVSVSVKGTSMGTVTDVTAVTVLLRREMPYFSSTT